MPEFTETRDYPQHYEVVRTAIQDYNRPTILTKIDTTYKKKVTDRLGAKYIRSSKQSHLGSAKKFSVVPGRDAQWDEYPYSSTLEGGYNSVFGAVDTEQNRLAGERLDRFYEENPGLVTGCKFKVKLAP